MPKALTKKKRPTLKSKSHQGCGVAGHEERLASYIKRTLQLHGEGEPFHRIALKIADEYQLEKVPAVSTVANWRAQGFDAINEDIHELQVQLRMDQFNTLEDMKSKWLPLATAERLAIMRWKMVEGELQPELDENAIAEQVKANEQVIKIMARQAKLLGLDLQAPEEKKDGDMSMQSLQLWIINQQQNFIAGTAPVGGHILELEGTGLPELEE